jgi:copper(I)-binding protein
VSDSVADRAEVHEVVTSDMAEGDMDSSTDGDMSDGDMDEMDDREGSEGMDDMDDMDDMEGMDGPMVMQELTEGLALTADETVSFEPGGYHVMLLDLAEPLELGDEIDVTLEFAEAGSMTVTVEVAESAP